jgi:hypothetical protein
MSHVNLTGAVCVLIWIIVGDLMCSQHAMFISCSRARRTVNNDCSPRLYHTARILLGAADMDRKIDVETSDNEAIIAFAG